LTPLAALRRSARFLRGNILIFCITGAIGMFGRMMAFPYSSLFILELGGRPEDVGLVNSLSPLAGLILFPIAGYLSDRSSRVSLIVVSGAIAAVCSLLYVVAPVWQVVAIAGVLRSVTVLQFPPSSAMIADSLAPEDRGRGVAAMSTFSGLPAMIAPYVAGIVLDRAGILVGMRSLFGFLLLATLTSTLIHRRYLKETTTVDKTKVRASEMLQAVVDTYRGLPDLLHNMPRGLRAHAGLVALGFMSSAIAGPFWVVYAVEQIGLSSEQWGLILLVESAVRNGSYLGAGSLVDRFGRTRCMVSALALVLVTAPLFILAIGFWGVLAVRVMAALASAIFIPASSALMADIVPRATRGRTMAAIGRGSFLLAPAAGGTGGPGTGYLITLPIVLSSFAAGHLYALEPTLPWIALGVLLLGALVLAAAFVRDPAQAEA